MDTNALRIQAERFRELHRGSPILVLPNAWDASSAKIFEQAGFAAIGTTSGGVAALFGYPDGQRISRAEMLLMIKRIAESVAVPVSADIEAGYGDTIAQVAETIRAVIAAGAVGINIEDGAERPDKPLLDIDYQTELIRELRNVAAATGVPLVINARTDVYLTGIGDAASRFDETVRRANAYRQAGADCLFVIGVRDRETIARLVRAIDGPLNILTGPGAPTIPELEQLGVARASFGSGPMRATLPLVRKIALELRDHGTYDSIAQNEFTHSDVNRMFDK